MSIDEVKNINYRCTIFPTDLYTKTAFKHSLTTLLYSCNLYFYTNIYCFSLSNVSMKCTYANNANIMS